MKLIIAIIIAAIYAGTLNLPADEQIEYLHDYCISQPELMGCGDPDYK